MGNHHSGSHGSQPKQTSGSEYNSDRRNSKFNHNKACLEKLFQKLELTAEDDNGHPGELSRETFENVFHGPLHIFGRLLFRQMCDHGSKLRITCEQFVKSGKELLKLFDEVAQHKYYFKLFADGKDHLTKEDCLTMVNISYALTLSSSMIPYSKSARDDKVFESMVEGMFGIQKILTYATFEKWLSQHCPHMFCGVHNWVYTILTGAKMPSELETAPVPLLEKFIEGKHCMSMGLLWSLSASLPYLYTHTEKEGETTSDSSNPTRNPLLTSFQFLMKLARITRCQSWTNLYDSDEHGMSQNRFSTHVSSYKGPCITLLSFEGRNIYCLALDKGWKEGLGRFGGEGAMLIQVTPVYRVVLANEPLVQWNEFTRGIPKGIQVGKATGSVVIYLPAEFDQVQHYGVNCELQRVEVWGCGGNTALKAQVTQNQWERKDVEKQKQKKLHIDVNWDENPDKQLLSWGGVQVNHQFSRAGN